MATQTQARPVGTLPTTMKAVRIHEYGGADKLMLEDVPRPEPGANEVLVRVVGSAINPVDWKIRAGHIPGHTLPLTLGWDFSGVVAQPGPGVTQWKVNDEVYTRPNVMKNGAYAEYIVVAASELARKPRNLNHYQAAAIPLAGLTAWQALFDHGHLQAGQRVLIHAGSGGVGGYAIQLAKWKGAHVITTASAANATYVRKLGADEAIDYRSYKFEDHVKDVDLVIDTLGGDTLKRSFQVVKRGGAIVSTLEMPEQAALDKKDLRGAVFMAETKTDELDQLAKLADEEKIRSLAEALLPLSEVRKAHEMSESGHVRGKIVLQVG